MDGRMTHAKALGIITVVCAVVALLLGMNAFFLLVLVYRAGWLSGLTSLVAMGVAATMMAVAQVYVLGRLLGARRPELVAGVMDYCRANKLLVLCLILAFLAGLRLLAGAYIG